MMGTRPPRVANWEDVSCPAQSYLGSFGCVCGHPAPGWRPPWQGTRFSAQPSCSHAQRRLQRSSGPVVDSKVPEDCRRICQTARPKGGRWRELASHKPIQAYKMFSGGNPPLPCLSVLSVCVYSADTFLVAVTNCCG